MDSAEKQAQISETFTTAGRRWTQATVLTIQRKCPKQRWVHFAANVQDRHGAVRTKYEAIEQRVLAESPLSFESDRKSRSEIAETLISEAETPVGELPPAVERSSHFMLDGRLKGFLANLLDIRIPAVKIYANQAADALTRKHGADALTYQDNTLFRAGKYNPRYPAGLALLGHELTHAAQGKLENQSRAGHVPKTILESQERQALANEAKVLQHSSFPVELSSDMNFRRNHPHGQISARHPVKAGELKVPQTPERARRDYQLSHLQTGQPKAASSSREVSAPSETDFGLNSSAQLSEQQLSQIKEAVYRDLMDRIRIEFERGG